MFNVYFRNKDKSLGKIEADVGCHQLAANLVKDQLEEDNVLIKPIFVVIK